MPSMDAVVRVAGMGSAAARVAGMGSAAGRASPFFSSPISSFLFAFSTSGLVGAMSLPLEGPWRTPLGIVNV